MDDAAASEFQPACDRLADLGNAILGASDAATPAEVEDTVQTAIDDFVAAASQSGDSELSELANTVDEAFSTYLTAGGIDAREAGNEADIALDRSIQRCLKLGAINDFPQEPNP